VKTARNGIGVEGARRRGEGGVSYVGESQACGGVVGGGGALLEHGGGVDQGGGVVAAGGGGGARRDRGGVSFAGEPRVAVSFFA